MKKITAALKSPLGLFIAAMIVIGALLFWLASVAIAADKPPHPEKWYQAAWCGEHGGTMEVIFADGARADCVTADHAIEFDFAHKWAESVGQSLLYAADTGKRAGIVLIVGPGDEHYLQRLQHVIDAHKLAIDVYTVPR
jgi:hypothetical protein